LKGILRMEQEILYRKILDNVITGVYFVDTERKINFWNKGAERVSGYSESEVIGKSCRENILMHIDKTGKLLCNDGCPLQASMDDGKERSIEIFMKHKDGHRVPVMVHSLPLKDENGNITGAVEIFDDISPYLKLQKQIAELNTEAYVDPLTTVGSRRFIDNILEHWWHKVVHEGYKFGIIYIDLNDLKLLNDQFGHEIGDKALNRLAITLKNSIRDGDYIGRWGGDEFLILLELDSTEKIEIVEGKLNAMLQASSIKVKSQKIKLTASFGFALSSEAESIDELIRLADQRMYEDKLIKKGEL